MFQTRKAKVLWDNLNDAVDNAPVIVPCRGTDPDAWFPEPKDATVMSFRNATKLCAQCPVRMLCLEYAIENNELHGIWGGLTYKERVALKRK